jgi:hypothetical protein
VGIRPRPEFILRHASAFSCAAATEPTAFAAINSIEPWDAGWRLSYQRAFSEAAMNHWHDTMVERPETDGAAYMTGWTISGLAVLGTIVAVWILGI